MWNLPPPPGFQGLHPDKPVTAYQRHLPHWRQDGATYFVTFRLADAESRPRTRAALAPGGPPARNNRRHLEKVQLAADQSRAATNGGFVAGGELRPPPS